MKVLAIDDDEPSLEQLKETILRVCPEAELVCFSNPEDYDRYPDKASFEMAFLDIQLGSVSGIQLALDLKKYAPFCNIVYVTAFSEFAYAAIKTRASGYVMKPYTDEDILEEFLDPRYPPADVNTEDEKPVIHTFGNFEVLGKDNKPIRFSRTVSKEIFAYLIDQCGYPVTGKDIAADVLEEPDYQASVSKKVSQYISDLVKDLRNEGYFDIIKKQNRQIYISKNSVECDLFEALKGNSAALNSYKGEYLIEYSWAEFSDSVNKLKALSALHAPTSENHTAPAD